MTGEEAFLSWAPDESVWGAWAKPVAFAKVDGALANLNRAPGPAGAVPTDELPGPGDGTAVVVDLPGAAAVDAGLALARHGYRPVPLFNNADGFAAAIDTLPIRHALLDGAAELARLGLPPEAPPAFLIDAQRMAPGRRVAPGDFDNRWMVLPQDFPSAEYLGGQGIRRALLLRQGTGDVERDLVHILRRWQEGGIEIWRLDPAQPPAVRIDVPRPSGFRSLFYRLGVISGLRRNSAGGFGADVPVPGQGGGFG